MLLSDKLMRCCAAGTNGCLNFRSRASALNGRVSAKWSRCPGSIALETVWLQCDKAQQVGYLRRLSAGVGRRHPVPIRKASLMAGSTRRVWAEHCGTKQVHSNLQLQNCCSSTPARANKPPQERNAWCQLLAKWLKVSAIRERPVQRYSEVFGLGAEGQDFIVAVDLIHTEFQQTGMTIK